jgi:transposase-like protein
MWIYYTEKLSEGESMAAVALKCPFCGSEDVRGYGASNGKKRCACNNRILFS